MKGNKEPKAELTASTPDTLNSVHCRMCRNEDAAHKQRERERDKALNTMLKGTQAVLISM